MTDAETRAAIGRQTAMSLRSQATLMRLKSITMNDDAAKAADLYLRMAQLHEDAAAKAAT